MSEQIDVNKPDMHFNQLKNIILMETFALKKRRQRQKRGAEKAGVISRELCSGEDLKMEVNHPAIEIYIFFNGSDLAFTRNVPSMKWDKDSPNIYGGRLLFESPRNSITLRNVSYGDTGLYRIVTKSPKGEQRLHKVNLTVLVAPICEEDFSISTRPVNGSCYKLTCGICSFPGIPEVQFKWNVSNSLDQTIVVCNSIPSAHCVVVGPATKCLTRNLSAAHQLQFCSQADNTSCCAPWITEGQKCLPPGKGFPSYAIILISGGITFIIIFIFKILCRQLIETLSIHCIDMPISDLHLVNRNIRPADPTHERGDDTVQETIQMIETVRNDAIEHFEGHLSSEPYYLEM